MITGPITVTRPAAQNVPPGIALPAGPAGPPGARGERGDLGPPGPTTIAGLTDATPQLKALNVDDPAAQRQAMGAAGLDGPSVTFRRADTNAVDTLLKALVWQQGRSVIEFDPNAMSKSGVGGVALAKAVAALPDLGGVVLIPPMDQGSALNLTGQTIAIGAKPNVAIVGGGAGRSNAILTNGHNQDVVTVADGTFTPLLAGFTLTVYGTTGNAPAYVFNGPAAVSARLIDIEMVGGHSLAKVGGGRGRYSGLRCQDLKPAYGIGLRFDGPATAEKQQVWDCDFQNAPGQDAYAAIYIARGSSFEIIGVQAVKMGSPILIQPPAGSAVYSVVLIDWWSDTSSGVGMTLDGTNGIITRVETHASWFSSCLRGVDIKGNVWGAKFLAGTKVYDNFSDGVRVFSGATLKGLKFSDALIAGNGVRQGGNLATGINLLGSTSDFDIHDCSFGNDADFAENTYADIAIAAGVDKYSIQNNRFGRADGRAPVVGHTATATRIASGNRGWSP